MCDLKVSVREVDKLAKECVDIVDDISNFVYYW